MYLSIEGRDPSLYEFERGQLKHSYERLNVQIASACHCPYCHDPPPPLERPQMAENLPIATPRSWLKEMQQQNHKS